jgi:hypothetical protein
MQMINSFPITVKGQIHKSIEICRTIEGRRYSKFDITPPDVLNGHSVLPCIAFDTRAELLECFVSRGDIVEISGFLGQTEYIKENGEHVSESNIIEATAITFPEDNVGNDFKVEESA